MCVCGVCGVCVCVCVCVYDSEKPFSLTEHYTDLYETWYKHDTWHHTTVPTIRNVEWRTSEIPRTGQTLEPFNSAPSDDEQQQIPIKCETLVLCLSALFNDTNSYDCTVSAIDVWVRSSCGMVLTGEKRFTQRKICHSVTLPSTNSPMNGPGFEAGPLRWKDAWATTSSATPAKLFVCVMLNSNMAAVWNVS